MKESQHDIVLRQLSVKDAIEMVNEKAKDIHAIIVIQLENIMVDGAPLLRQHVITGGANKWERIGMMDSAFDYINDINKQEEKDSNKDE